MVSKEVKEQSIFLQLIVSAHLQQRKQLLNSMNSQQIRVLSAIVHNMLQGVISLKN